MDRDLYKAHCEQLRMTSYRIIVAIKGGYWVALCDLLLDCSNAFQTTRTDDVPKDQQVPHYCWPAPGSERRDEKGTKYLVYPVWRRLTHYQLNRPGPLPAREHT